VTRDHSPRNDVLSLLLPCSSSIQYLTTIEEHSATMIWVGSFALNEMVDLWRCSLLLTTYCTNSATTTTTAYLPPSTFFPPRGWTFLNSHRQVSPFFARSQSLEKRVWVCMLPTFDQVGLLFFLRTGTAASAQFCR
jgi:hypothetical protein